jgi:hypothetical protein
MIRRLNETELALGNLEMLHEAQVDRDRLMSRVAWESLRDSLPGAIRERRQAVENVITMEVRGESSAT